MTSFKNFAIGLTTVAALSTVTAAVASQPIGSGRENLNPEKAAQIQEVREALQAGDMKLAGQLKEQYGLKDFRKGHPGKRMKHGFMKMNHEKREAVKDALEAGDYAAFVEALGDHAPKDLTEEKFGQMVEVHQLRVAGDAEGAKELAKKYGLKKPTFGKRFHGGEEGEREEDGERSGPQSGDQTDSGLEE